MTKKPKTLPEKPASTPAKAEQSKAPVASKTPVNQASAAPKSPKKPQKVESKATAEQSEITPTRPKKSISVKAAPNKSETVDPKPLAATSTLSAQERAGLAAGSIWHYLNEKGSTSVAQLLKELPEEEKIIQRSIGWLAQEDKITLSIVDRVETIALKG